MFLTPGTRVGAYEPILLFEGSGDYEDSTWVSSHFHPAGLCDVDIYLEDSESRWFLTFPAAVAPPPAATARAEPTALPAATATPAPSPLFARPPERGDTISARGYQTFSFPLEPGNEQFVFTHEGDRMFVVVVRSDALVEERGVTMEVVLVDMRGPFETVVELLVKRPGTGYFEVITDGQWYIDLPG